MMDHSYQDPNELWTDYGLDCCFKNFDFFATGTEILIYKNNDGE